MSAILIGHPEGEICETLRALLEKSGHRVSVVHDGPLAVEAFRRRKPDIVILNRELPKLDSLQVFAEIKKLDPMSKVVVFAVREPETAEPRATFGLRVFRPGEVLRIVDELQESRRTRAQLERIAPKILVVDDDLDVLTALRRFLAEKGYEVAVAPSGAECLPLLKKLRPHLVLLDVDMPEMNGVETLKRVRELDREVGVMMITGNDSVEMMERCRDHGAYDYLIKPFDFRYLEFSVYSKILLMTL